MPNFDKLKDQIEITVTPEGLRIELLESATGTFFDLGNSTPNQNGKELLNCWRVNWANCRTKFLSRAIPIRSRIAGRGIMGIGSSPRTVPMPRDD